MSDGAFDDNHYRSVQATRYLIISHVASCQLDETGRLI